MKKNYTPMAEIREELKNGDLKNFLDFDSFGRYEFARCEGCDGPILGYLEVKCSGKDGVRYRSEAIRLFESWLKRVSGFREAVRHEWNRMEEMRAGKFAKVVRLAL